MMIGFGCSVLGLIIHADLILRRSALLELMIGHQRANGHRNYKKLF
jgi:hypothetical protein